MSEPDALQRVARSAADGKLLVGWRVTMDPPGFWTEYAPPAPDLLPEAGTKIHVSASVTGAADVLARCLPVLVERNVAFKHVANLRCLSFQSGGQGGPTQVGKFLTAYPSDATAAAELATLLHQATAGFSGPQIPHEQPYAKNSLVYFRQGSFARRWVQVPTGRIAPAVRVGDSWQIDDREANSRPAASPHRVLRDTYVLTHQVAHSSKGSTFLAFADDDTGGALVVVKEAYAHTMEDVTGRDARARLADEACCLAAVEADGIAPRLVDFWDGQASAFLVYAPIPGSTLSAALSDLAADGLRPPVDLLRSWADSLCDALTHLHRAGYVCSDIKPANLVLTPEGLRLIDLELAGPPTPTPVGGMGTPGYCSPQQADASTGRAITDDVYSIGATLLASATLTDASLLPELSRVAALEASREPTNPIYSVAARCVAPNPSDRFPTAAAVAAALREPTPRVDPPPTRVDWLACAAEIGDRIIAAAVDNGRYAYWRSDHPTVSGQPGRDLYAGSAGSALFLCDLADAADRPDALAVAARCGTWLAETEPLVPRQEPMPGLYFGECGPALLHLRLYRATAEDSWRRMAYAVLDRLDPGAVRSPDLMTGLAGIGTYSLAFWHSTGDERALAMAGSCAAELLRRRPLDRPVWRLPAGFERLSGREYAGLSHGTAGVGYFLAECSLASGDPALIEACQELADWVVGQGQPALADGSALSWRGIDGSARPYGTNWCHGGPGMARFLLRAYATTGDPAHLVAARRASLTSTAAGWIGTTQCHGLAGNLEVLLDLAQTTGDAAPAAAAGALAENLATYRTATGWQSDKPGLWSPDLMVGEAGVGAALLRLSCPETPHLVSCAAFGAQR